ncbi:MAG: hypothetical protein RLZZ234_653 [Candidatus Parcubacteria bacterium]|jgi:hypothetical protein
MKSHWYQKIITQLRQQPPEVKSHVALIAAGTLTTLVALVWVTTLPARFATIGTLDNGVASSTALMMDALSPLVPKATIPAADTSESAADTPEELQERVANFKKELEARQQEEESTTDFMESATTGAATPIQEDTSTVGKPVLIEVR